MSINRDNQRTRWPWLLLVCAALAGAGCSEGAHREEGHKGQKHSGAAEHKDEHGEGHKDNEDEDHEPGVVALTEQAMVRMGIQTVKVTPREMPPVINTTGEVDYNQDRLAHVSPRVRGRVHTVRASLGQTVKRGEVLAVIDSLELGQAKAAYLRAKAQVALAKVHLQREERLLKERISSRKEVIDGRGAFLKASADHQAARQSLVLLGLSSKEIKSLRYNDPRAALMPLRAPISGRVVKKHITRGEMVSASRNVFSVADLSRVWIWIDVFERDLAKVHLQDTAQVQVSAYPDRVFKGVVGYIGDEVRRDTRAVRARLDIDNSDGSLKPGMFAKVRLIDPHAADGKATRRKVLVVPDTALQRDGGEQVVFVALSGVKFVRRAVQIGVATDGHVEVRSGLKAGESVVTKGAFLLKSELSKESMGEHGH